MQFTIPCETFARLSYAALLNPKPEYDHINCIRIENINGDSYAIATNSMIAAVQYLGKTDSAENGGVCVMIIPELVQQCISEQSFDSVLTIDAMETEFYSFASAKTTFGYIHPHNVGWFPADHLYKRPWNTLGSWRIMLPEGDKLPKKSKGFLFMDTEQITNLGKTSPSGRIVFPEIIDSSFPVLVRDSIDPSWVGIFLPRDAGSQSSLSPATYPDWL